MAFSAYPLATHQYQAAARETLTVPVTLGGVLLNAGDAYDASTSTFTCPIAGYYAFFGDINIQGKLFYTEEPPAASLSLYKGESFLHTIAIIMNSNVLENFTFHATTDCQQGEEVNVILTIDNASLTWAASITLTSLNFPLTTFSGHILRDGL